MLFILLTNFSIAWQLLLNKGGWVDTSMNIGVKGMFQIIQRRYEGTDTVRPWSLSVEGNVKEDIRDRGVGETELPYYPFRDDALRLHTLIREYVAKVVKHHYQGNVDPH